MHTTTPKQARGLRRRSLATRELEMIEAAAIKVIDQLAAVVGYADVALQRRREKLGICEELHKIQRAADKAMSVVKMTMAHVKSVSDSNL